MSVRVLELAEIELAEAVAYYEAQLAGLGDAFLLEFLRVIDLIERFPEGWHALEEGVRRCRLLRFPYGVVYSQEKGEILILAIAHLHRRPSYWRTRRP